MASSAISPATTTVIGSRVSNPFGIDTAADLTHALHALQRAAARGTGRARISLDTIATRTGVPRSTLHAYLSGKRLPTPDALDALLLALGVRDSELGAWADALDRVVANGERVPRPGPTPVPQQLPAGVRGFVGRDAELRALDQLVHARLGYQPPEPLVVVVSGAGGIGKSTLVATWAHRNRDLFPDGQLWIDLRGYGSRSPLTAVTALGRLLRGVGYAQPRLPGDADTRAELFRTAVAGRRLLLVLDNAADSAQVRALLPGARECTVVVTGRTQLRPLVAETGAARMRLGPLSMREGTALLLARTQDPGGLGNQATARRVVAACAGLPLALRIVGERLSEGTGAELARVADELADRRSRLSSLALAERGRELGVRPVLAASYAALAADEASLFRLLPLCLGRDLALGAVAACAGRSERTTRALLESLAAANLIEAAGPDRFAINDLVATFADECRRADAVEEVPAAEGRLLRYLVAGTDASCAALGKGDKLPFLAGDHLSSQRPPPDGDPLSWLLDTADLIIAACTRALDRDEPEPVWPLLDRAAQALVHRGDLAPFLPPLRSAAAAAAAAGRVREEAMMWRGAGVGAAIGGDLAAARTAFTRMSSLARALGDANLENAAETNLAMAEMLSGRCRDAVRRLGPALAFRENLGLPRIHVHNALVVAWHALGELDRAWEHARQAAQLTGDAQEWPSSRALAHFNLGWILLARGGCPDDVLHHTRLGSAELTEQPDALAVLTRGSVDVAALLALGRHDDAAALLDDLLPLAVSMPTPESVDVMIENGRLLARTDSGAAAVAAFTSAVAMARRLGLSVHLARALVTLAGALRDSGDAEAADGCAAEAVALARAGQFRLVPERRTTLRAGR